MDRQQDAKVVPRRLLGLHQRKAILAVLLLPEPRGEIKGERPRGVSAAPGRRAPRESSGSWGGPVLARVFLVPCCTARSTTSREGFRLIEAQDVGTAPTGAARLFRTSARDVP